MNFNYTIYFISDKTKENNSEYPEPPNFASVKQVYKVAQNIRSHSNFLPSFYDKRYNIAGGKNLKNLKMTKCNRNDETVLKKKTLMFLKMVNNKNLKYIRNISSV